MKFTRMPLGSVAGGLNMGTQYRMAPDQDGRSRGEDPDAVQISFCSDTRSICLCNTNSNIANIKSSSESTLPGCITHLRQSQPQKPGYVPFEFCSVQRTCMQPYRSHCCCQRGSPSAMRRPSRSVAQLHSILGDTVQVHSAPRHSCFLVGA
jgi:hypothetical protein